MSYQDTDAVWKMAGLTPTQKHFLGALAWHRNGDRKSPKYNQCNPGFELLAEETGLGLSSIHRSTGQLEEKGILRVDRDPHRKKSNRYHFCWNESSTVISESSTTEDQSSTTEDQSSTVGFESSTTEVNKEVTGKINREAEQDSSSAAAVSPPVSLPEREALDEVYGKLGGKPGKPSDKLLALLRGDGDSVREVLSHPLLVLKLKQKKSPVNALIHSIQEGYWRDWLEKAEKLESKHAVDSPPVPANPPIDDEDFGGSDVAKYDLSGLED